jgi:hypothetical protein
MKGIYFKRKNSVLRVGNDGAPTVRSTNYDRYIYFAILSVVVLYLLYYLTVKFFFIRADGHVLYDDVKIRLTGDSRIIKFYREEGDSICRGDTLFTYIEDQEEGNGGGGGGMSLSGLGVTAYGNTNQTDWIDKEIYNLDKKIALNNIEISEQSVMLKMYKADLKRVKNEVTLDALPHSRLEFTQNEIAKIHSGISKLSQENNQLYGLIAKLRGIAKEYRPIKKSVNLASLTSNGGSGSADDSQVQVFFSPIDGIINRVFLNDFEVALREDQIMSVQRKTKIYVKAYFEQEDMNYFKEGDTLDLRFPDGTKSRGYIRRFYFGTYPLPEEFQKRYEPVKRTIAADILPVNQEEEQRWKVYNKLSVEITKTKF